MVLNSKIPLFGVPASPATVPPTYQRTERFDVAGGDMVPWNTRGPLFPTSPGDHHIHFLENDTIPGLEEPFYWDVDRGLWLSFRTWEWEWVSAGGIAGPAYLTLPGVGPGSATIGRVLREKAVVVRIEGNQSAASGTNGIVSLHRDGSQITPSAIWDASADVAFDFPNRTNQIDLGGTNNIIAAHFSANTAAGLSVRFTMHRYEANP